MPRDPTPTPRSCPACQGDGEGARQDCRLCLGSGQVTAAQAARWQAHRSHRLTEQFIRIEDQVREMVLLLEKHVHERTWLVNLLNEGRALLRTHGAASRLPPGTPERTEGVRAYVDFNGRALRAINSEKPQP